HSAHGGVAAASVKDEVRRTKDEATRASPCSLGFRTWYFVLRTCVQGGTDRELHGKRTANVGRPRQEPRVPDLRRRQRLSARPGRQPGEARQFAHGPGRDGDRAARQGATKTGAAGVEDFSPAGRSAVADQARGRKEAQQRSDPALFGPDVRDSA